MNVLRDLRSVVELCFHAPGIDGVRAAMREGLSLPTVYDIHVVLCETKRAANSRSALLARGRLLLALRDTLEGPLGGPLEDLRRTLVGRVEIPWKTAGGNTREASEDHLEHFPDT